MLRIILIAMMALAFISTALRAQDQDQRKPASTQQQQPGGADLPTQGKGTADRVRGELQNANIALRGATSYAPVATEAELAQVMKKMQGEKAALMKKHQQLLESRYDLSNRTAQGVTMSRGKPVQAGVRVKLSQGMSWDQLASMSPEQVRQRDAFPQGFLPLPHPNHPEGGMVFPKFHIDEVKRQEGRDLTRFDLDYDLPDHFLPEFPAAIFTDNAAGSGRCFARSAHYQPELLPAV